MACDATVAAESWLANDIESALGQASEAPTGFARVGFYEFPCAASSDASGRVGAGTLGSP